MKLKLFAMMMLLASMAHAGGSDIGNSEGAKVEGLVCDDDEHNVKVVVEIETDGQLATMALRGSSRLSPFMVMDTETAMVAPILNNKLEKMDNVMIKDDVASMKFRIDGRDFQGKVRIGIIVEQNGERLFLRSCNPKFETKAYQF